MEGRAELREACVNVAGDSTVASGAELRVANCRNVGDGYGAGGVNFFNALHVDGTLEVHQSHSHGRGGGVHVWGTWEQRVEPWRRA